MGAVNLVIPATSKRGRVGKRQDQARPARVLRPVASLLIPLALSMPAGGAQASLPIVPGAAGFGMQTRAAYACGTNPAVYRVTNLNDTGEGSLRAALTASNPRVVIFEISGYINITSNINVTSPCLTVAGQTAPSPGITVRVVGGYPTEGGFVVGAHDTLWQHFRIRPGDGTCNSGIQFWNFNNSSFDVYNNVLDHMSISWAQDEGVAFVTTPHDSTVWRSIVAEILIAAPGSSDCTGGGISSGNGVLVGRGKNIALLQNLYAHNAFRSPQIGGSGSTVVQNNLIYAPVLGPWWGVQPGEGPFMASAVGNYVRRDSNTASEYRAFATRNAVTGSQLYLNDNVLDNGPVPPGFTEFAVIANEGIDPRVSSPPVAVPGYSPLSGSATYAHVLANAGARPRDRDAVDLRIIKEVGDRTGRYVSQVSEVGGYPFLAVNRRTLTLPSNPHIVTASGYTNLELWLHNLAAAVETAEEATSTLGPAPPVNVRIDPN